MSDDPAGWASTGRTKSSPLPSSSPTTVRGSSRLTRVLRRLLRGLSSVGVVRSKHAGVVAAVAQTLVRDRGLDPDAGRLLRSLFERRSRADYDLGAVPRDEGPRAVVDVRVVVDAIAEWLSP